MHPLIRPSVLALVWIGTLAAGCSDESGPAQRTVLVERAFDGGPLGDGGLPPVRFDDAGRPIPDERVLHGRILVLAGDDERTVNVGGRIELGVLLFDHYGDPVGGERIEFAFDAEDVGDAELSARRVFTADDGLARVELRAGTRVQDLLIKVAGSNTRELEITVHVVEMPVGGLDVRFEYDGPVPLGATEVYLVDDPTWCDDPHFLVAPEGTILSGNAPNPSGSVMLQPVLAGTRGSLVVRARLSNDRTLAGAGCFGDVRVPEGELRRVSVPLFLLPLSPAGTYTLQNHFDFSNAIPGTVGDVIRQLVRFFGDQNHEREIAGVIFDVVEELVRQAAGAIGGVVIGLVRGWVEDDLNDIINRYIDRDAPDWVRNFFQIGSDLISIVSNMEVISNMRITKPRRDGTFDGSQNWIGLAFYWRLPCNGNPDPDCGRHAFTMDQVAQGLEGVRLVFGQFTGRIHTYNQGVIDSHTLDLQYGRLILFVLNNILLPNIANGANNLRDALINLGNCPAFANGLTGGRDHLRIGGINIVSRDTIEGWCTNVLGVVGDAANLIIGRLRVDTRMTVEGRMLFLEEDEDLLADAIVDGVWEGIIRTAEDQGPPFQGDFAGSRD